MAKKAVKIIKKRIQKANSAPKIRKVGKNPIKAISKSSNRIVIHNNKAILHYSTTNIPSYEAVDRTFKIQETTKTYRFYEISRKKKPVYSGSIKKTVVYQNKKKAIKAFSDNLEYSQTETTIGNREGMAFTNHQIISNKIKTKQKFGYERNRQAICQLLAVVGIYDRKIKKSYKFIGYSKSFPQSDLSNTHAMNDHEQDAIYSAIGSYTRYHKISRFSYKSNRFICSITDTKIIYRYSNQLVKIYRNSHRYKKDAKQ